MSYLDFTFLKDFLMYDLQEKFQNFLKLNNLPAFGIFLSSEYSTLVKFIKTCFFHTEAQKFRDLLEHYSFLIKFKKLLNI